MNSGWQARFPDLTGKTAVVACTDTPELREVVIAMSGAGMRLAVVAARRDRVEEVAPLIEGAGVDGYALTGDVRDPALWERVLPHVEQRLGPIDVTVALGLSAAPTLAAAAGPDMAARGRGTIVTVAPDGIVPSSLDTSGAPRSRLIVGGTPSDIGTAVLIASSDVIEADRIEIQLSGG